ncbi:AraC family transcriptional regulator [Aureimonas altamirensis]|uniref:AraC family transcriptional regulator n=1 Tax=Aureimonas altamirensis TaxID=370622 RepID=UPI00068CFC80|nr:AraC family transcriptional regulator [Aureimonas altamirensis]
MIDPLAEVIALLKPRASFAKMVTASGSWAVRPPHDKPFYAALLEGEVTLTAGGRASERLHAGDFVLLPATDALQVTSRIPPEGGRTTEPLELGPGVFRIGPQGTPDTRMLVGTCTFGSDDSALLVSLLPDLVIVRGERRLTMLVELLNAEARGQRPGRDVVLGHLLQVLLIEAFRTTKLSSPAPGLLRGLSDERLAPALRRMHGEPARPWTVGELAREAALSRSSFYDRFRREVGVAPMDYLLKWRMALAKDLLRGADSPAVGDVARRVGYSSQSTFSVAFSREVGATPRTYARRIMHGMADGADVQASG